MFPPKNYFIRLGIEEAEDISFVYSRYRPCSRSYNEVYIIPSSRFSIPPIKTLVIMFKVVTQVRACQWTTICNGKTISKICSLGA